MWYFDASTLGNKSGYLLCARILWKCQGYIRDLQPMWPNPMRAHDVEPCPLDLAQTAGFCIYSQTIIVSAYWSDNMLFLFYTWKKSCLEKLCLWKSCLFHKLNSTNVVPAGEWFRVALLCNGVLMTDPLQIFYWPFCKILLLDSVGLSWKSGQAVERLAFADYVLTIWTITLAGGPITVAYGWASWTGYCRGHESKFCCPVWLGQYLFVCSGSCPAAANQRWCWGKLLTCLELHVLSSLENGRLSHCQWAGQGCSASWQGERWRWQGWLRKCFSGDFGKTRSPPEWRTAGSHGIWNFFQP